MIGIIVAEPEELNAIKEYLTGYIVEEEFDIKFYVGDIGNRRFALTLGGLGKVNAARTTQLLIDTYKPDYVINCGVAGGISDLVNAGDIVIAEKVAQHDFDLTAFGREKGEVSDKVPKYLYSNKTLVQKAYMKILNDETISGIVGTIVSGDQFVTDPNEASKIHEIFDADCCEMEGAAVAQVCYLDDTPFIIIRCISDTPNNNNKVEFDKFIKYSSGVVSKLIYAIIND